MIDRWGDTKLFPMSSMATTMMGAATTIVHSAHFLCYVVLDWHVFFTWHNQDLRCGGAGVGVGVGRFADVGLGANHGIELSFCLLHLLLMSDSEFHCVLLIFLVLMDLRSVDGRYSGALKNDSQLFECLPSNANFTKNMVELAPVALALYHWFTDRPTCAIGGSIRTQPSTLRASTTDICRLRKYQCPRISLSVAGTSLR